MPTRLGLIINPLAGLGGPAALKGSDDVRLVSEIRDRGAELIAPVRAANALATLAAAGTTVELLTGPSAMGEDEARVAGFEPLVVGSVGATTTANDTRAIASELAGLDVDLLLFAGGDGTAVDILAAVGDRIPVLGIPAGVKMHSAVFAVNPRAAGELAGLVATGRARRVVEAEVMDVDEDALRAGSVSARLHGYLRVPAEPSRVQGGKARSAVSDQTAQQAIARYLVDTVLDDRLCLVGPGTTTGVLMRELGLEKTLLGVDVVRGRELVQRDADEQRLLELANGETLIVVTPVGGQGFVFGRGNQQLSPGVIKRVGAENIVVVATETKLAGLGGRPLLVDTGDSRLDDSLSGYRRIVTGYGREIVHRISA